MSSPFVTDRSLAGYADPYVEAQPGNLLDLISFCKVISTLETDLT